MKLGVRFLTRSVILGIEQDFCKPKKKKRMIPPSVFIYWSFCTGTMWYKVSFLAQLNSFLSPRSGPNQDKRDSFAQLFIYNWKDNNWINTFNKVFSAMWDASSLV